MSIRQTCRNLAGRLLAIIALLLSFTVVVADPGEAASAAHPYSNPVWWPLSTSGAKMGCYHGNGPDCQNPVQHTVYAIDVSLANNSSTPVYAMGAGIAHVITTDWACGDGPGLGNWLFVDHSNGTTSVYGHLGTINVKTGQLVTPLTELGTAGRSGYQPACDDPTLNDVRLLWLGIRHGGTYFHFTTSYVCVNGQTTLWPTKMSTYPTNDWNNVPAHTDLPSSTRTCIPAVPATPSKPTVTSFTRTAVSTLTAVWAAARTADHVTAINVQLQEFHTDTLRWVNYVNRRLSSGATRTKFLGLPTGRQFRVRVWMANTVGWSAPSNWATRTLL